MQGIGPLWQTPINFYITLVVVAIFVIVKFVNISFAIDKLIKIILGVFEFPYSESVFLPAQNTSRPYLYSPESQMSLDLT